jgi:hypothetical protein
MRVASPYQRILRKVGKDVCWYVTDPSSKKWTFQQVVRVKLINMSVRGGFEVLTAALEILNQTYDTTVDATPREMLELKKPITAVVLRHAP